MTGIIEPSLRLFNVTRTGTFLPRTARYPFVEMPAGAVIERDEALLAGAVGIDPAEFTQKWQLAIILVVDLLRFRGRLANHLCKFCRTGTINLGKIHGLGRGAVEPGDSRNKCVKVGIGIGTIAPHRLGGFAQTVLMRVMHHKAEFLLRRIRLSPELAFFR